MLSTVTIDVGTTSVKLCHFDQAGVLRAAASHPTPTTSDAFGEVYDHAALVDAIGAFLTGLPPDRRRDVRRIAITGVGESGGLVRPDGVLASPMILWHDHRGAPILERLSAAERTRISVITGLPVNPNYGVSKAAWAVRRATDSNAQWLNVAEYIAMTMTGTRWAEPSLASRTMAMDLRSGAWSDEVCGLFDLPTATFPPLREAAHGTALSAAFAASTGLPEDVRVHVAGHDHMVGAVGAGLRAGELLNSTGTTEGLLFVDEEPHDIESAVRSRLASGRACTGGQFTHFASIPTGGAVFAALRALLADTESQLLARIDGAHSRYRAGDYDLASLPLVLPYFRGSPPPDKDAAARGVVSGITPRTSADDLVLGCFLGMALQFVDVLELFGVAPTRIKVIGPASRNPLWLQLKADLLGVPLSVSGVPEVVSRGAQAIASGETVSWESNEPRDVLVDAAAHERLLDWRACVRPVWEHLKNTPVGQEVRR